MTRRNELRITTRSERGTVVISLHGAMTTDSPIQGELEREIRKLLDSGLRRFILDLEYLDKLDGSGIGEILRSRELVTDRDGELSVRGAATIYFDGRMTESSPDGETLSREIHSLLDIGVRRLVLDLEHIKFMDSAGPGDLVHLYTQVAERGGEISIVNLPRKIKDLLQILSIASLFEP